MSRAEKLKNVERGDDAADSAASTAIASPAIGASVDPTRWLEDHGDFLLRFALSRVRDRDAAEDLVQETFIAAIKAKERFAGTSAIRTWLVGILKHKILDHFRAKSRTVLAGDLAASAGGEDAGDEGDFFSMLGRWNLVLAPKPWAPSPQEAMETSDFQRVLQDCVSKLPDSMARLFVLRDVEEVDSDEVCKIMGISPSNLYTTLHRARFRLRRCLEVNWFGWGPEAQNSRLSAESNMPGENGH